MVFWLCQCIIKELCMQCYRTSLYSSSKVSNTFLVPPWELPKNKVVILLNLFGRRFCPKGSVEQMQNGCMCVCIAEPFFHDLFSNVLPIFDIGYTGNSGDTAATQLGRPAELFFFSPHFVFSSFATWPGSCRERWGFSGSSSSCSGRTSHIAGGTR